MQVWRHRDSENSDDDLDFYTPRNRVGIEVWTAAHGVGWLYLRIERP